MASKSSRKRALRPVFKTVSNINGAQFVNFLRLLRSMHPETECFILYVDGARYYESPLVKEWLKRHPEFHLSPIPAYSPQVNLIERLWKFLRAKALSRWHKTLPSTRGNHRLQSPGRLSRPRSATAQG
jgi:hypothetical protein